MKIHSLLPLVAASLVAVSSASASVGFFEGFDSGLAGWTTTGDVAIVASGGNSSARLTNAFTGGFDDPTELNLSGIDPVAAGGALETAAGLPAGALDLSLLNQATEGSVLARSFTVEAGDVLSFDWQLLTQDVGGADYAFLTVGNSLITLGNAASAALPGSGDYLAQTGLSTYQYTFANAGTFQVSFGIADVGDYAVSSALSLDNVALTPIPEPSTYAAILGAAGLVGAMIHRRKRA